MGVNIKRIDNLGESLLEEWNCTDIDAALAILQQKTGIDFAQHWEEIATHPDTSFQRREMVCGGGGGYLANVTYLITLDSPDGPAHARDEPTPDTLETEYSRGIGRGYAPMK
jgi:hypothetical protein